MIRLDRAPKPIKLDKSTADALTASYATDPSKSVWNLPYVKEGLLASSNNKCAYCEAIVIEESKYVEVEHFRCKKHYPQKVVEWSNLLPSCKKCNGNKGEHDVEVEGMILNPYEDNIGDYLYFQNYRLRWKNEIGRNTVDVLYINDSARLVSVRVQIGNAIAESLEETRRLLEEYLGGKNSTRRRNRIFNAVEILLREAQPSAQYSALAATIILTNDDYFWIKEQLALLNLWSSDLSSLHSSAGMLALMKE